MLNRILSAGEGKIKKDIDKILYEINFLEPHYSSLTDDELKSQTNIFKQRLLGDETFDDLLSESYAVVREAAWRVLGKKPYDVQVMGAIALHRGYIGEISTGEGKTLIATMPSYLNALSGDGVHVVTVNDFLVKEQAEQMSRVHQFLGLEVGYLLSSYKPNSESRRRAYNADITYGTNTEFGFDYLRDNLVKSKDECVQRGQHFAIVDEVDSVLIDDAITPLIISGPADVQTSWFYEFAKIIEYLDEDIDYFFDSKRKIAYLEEPGIEKLEDLLGIDNFYDLDNGYLTAFIPNAILAKHLYIRDKDYIVRNDKVELIDVSTGRIMEGRRLEAGLHQAIEAKEGVKIVEENVTTASISLQNYFKLYSGLCGMTGTAYSEAAELYKTYGLGVVKIPKREKSARIDKVDLVFSTEAAKFDQIVDDVKKIHATGQPILVGTTSVAKSEILSQLFTNAGLKHNVLNAKNVSYEGHIVAEAGRLNAITIATSMAGRGTDIILGGNIDKLAEFEMNKLDINPGTNPSLYEQVYPNILLNLEEKLKDEKEKVISLGGLYVIGAERNKSRRVDDQLIGRSGRQSDPGVSQFYLSFDDDVLYQYHGGLASKLVKDGQDSTRLIRRRILEAQDALTSKDRMARADILKYDDVLVKQREIIYKDRNDFLNQDVLSVFKTFVDSYVIRIADESMDFVGVNDEAELQYFLDKINAVFPYNFQVSEFSVLEGTLHGLDRKRIVDEVLNVVHQDINLKDIDVDSLRSLILKNIDTSWSMHLTNMDILKSSVGLRSYAGKEPFVEYERDAIVLFKNMIIDLEKDCISDFYKLDISVINSAD